MILPYTGGSEYTSDMGITDNPFQTVFIKITTEPWILLILTIGYSYKIVMSNRQNL